MRRFLLCTALMALLAVTTSTTSQTAPTTVTGNPIEMLLDEVDALTARLETIRVELAAARLEARTAERELAELKQFLQDHHELGSDFEAYRAIKAIAEQEARDRRVQQMRDKRAAEQAKRLEARRAEEAITAPTRREERYRDAGFTGVGNEVYVSQMAFYYRTQDNIPFRFDYIRGIGRYQRFYPPTRDVDFSSMTISGSVLNGSEEIRNIGIALAFFDENGNQVGGETIRA